jgi:hypothetical protein
MFGKYGCRFGLLLWAFSPLSIVLPAKSLLGKGGPGIIFLRDAIYYGLIFRNLTGIDSVVYLCRHGLVLHRLFEWKLCSTFRSYGGYFA